MGHACGVPPRLRLGEDPLLPFEEALLVRVVDAGRFELRHLEPQQVHLAGPGALVPAEGRDRVADLPEPGASGVQRAQIDAGVGIQGCSLDGRTQQGLVLVLPVQIDELGAPVGERGDGRHPSVHIRAAAPLGRHGAGEDHLLTAGGDEPALDPRLARAGAHQHAVGPAADEELDGLDDEGLARARLTGQGGQARPQDERQLLDHPQVSNGELGQHGYGGPRPNRAVITRQKSRSPNVIRRAGVSPARHSIASPSARRPQ